MASMLSSGILRRCVPWEVPTFSSVHCSFSSSWIVSDSQLDFPLPHVDKSPAVMKSLKYLSYIGKIAGFVSALNVIPFVDPKIGIIAFAAASLLKDTVNRIGDLIDDGKPNQSFKS